MELSQSDIARFNQSQNERKFGSYWIGFLEGILASGGIENKEPEALKAEIVEFLENCYPENPRIPLPSHDALDLWEDLSAECFSSDRDMVQGITDYITFGRDELENQNAFIEKEEFHGFLAGIICDGEILDAEVNAIRERFNNQKKLQSAPDFNDLHNAVFERSSNEDIRECISSLVGSGYGNTGIPNLGSIAKQDDCISDPSQIQLAGSQFVMTGKMNTTFGSRKEIATKIKACGGKVADRVTSKTNYLVLGDKATHHWSKTNKGNKIISAKKLKSSGHKIDFVHDYHLEQALKR